MGETTAEKKEQKLLSRAPYSNIPLDPENNKISPTGQAAEGEKEPKKVKFLKKNALIN